MTLSGLSLSKTTPLRTNLPHRQPENVQRVSAFLMPITNLTFGRIHTVNLIRFRHLRFPSSRNFAALKSSMAEEANLKSTVESTKNNKTESEKKQEESKVTIPPPPEKPLPDDCCGSGCVRCVWDMYYEELEEYNKLYKSNPDVKPS
ncbi:uncharacterized protein [Solanum tuberosum]|uniref:uncharacterized protein isoform X3 n=1 Tax=Solanum tuberosum TaxID=4113 RepID=UPI0003D2412E|nr:PREDICTED: uncharacterized protein LOC102600744 isoform X3 [Solanum tuberosum]XP_015160100.1 PREDICTED: uncharacterized protein LOC102600744 isoform X2 [Solanum tuberosum]